MVTCGLSRIFPWIPMVTNQTHHSSGIQRCLWTWPDNTNQPRNLTVNSCKNAIASRDSQTPLKKTLRGGKKVGPSQDLQSYALEHINPDFGPKCQDNFQGWKTKGKKNKKTISRRLERWVFLFFFLKRVSKTYATIFDIDIYSHDIKNSYGCRTVILSLLGIC